MNRTALGRHSRIDDNAGDPLDGLVNLFDIGVVLAVAFLVAGLGLSVDRRTGKIEQRPATSTGAKERQLESEQLGPATTGRGEAVGTVYRLSDGRLVVVGP